ncbi:hypothetical protein Tco_1310216 [Tanacetum coccineum]
MNLAIPDNGTASADGFEFLGCYCHEKEEWSDIGSEWQWGKPSRANQGRRRKGGVEVATTTETKVGKRVKWDCSILEILTSKNAKKASDFERLRNAPEEHVCCAEGGVSSSYIDLGEGYSKVLMVYFAKNNVKKDDASYACRCAHTCYRAEEGEELDQIVTKNSQGGVRSMTFSHDGKYVLSSTLGERYVDVWEVAGRKKKSACCVLAMDCPDICIDSRSRCQLLLLLSILESEEREFRSSRKHFKTLSLDESRSPNFDLFSDQEEYSEEEVAETMAETMEQYMSKIRADYGSGVSRPKIEDKDNFELKGQFLKELRTNTFSNSDHEDANEHTEKVLEIVDLFHIHNITIDQVMLRAFPMSLTGAASRWLRNKPYGSITIWEDLKTKFLSKYCLPARTTKKMEEINNFQQELDENLYHAWERFKDLLMKYPQHYLKTDADAKVAIQEMAEYSQKWYNGTSRTRSTETSDGLATIQAQLNNLGSEIKKVNKKVYAAQVGCEQCKGIHYTKDCPLKEEGKTLKEAYYTQFGAPFQRGGYRATAPGFYE